MGNKPGAPVTVMFENSKWIACDKSNTEVDGSFLFRRSFRIEQTVRSAVMSVCGLGYGVCHINGSSVTEDVLTTPFTRFDKTVLYNTYDITHLMRSGENVIGVMLGNGFFNDVADVWDFEKASWRHIPMLILQLDIVFANGEKMQVNSDTCWKTNSGPIVYNHARCGEIYDARLEQDNWNGIGFDDSGWESAYICRSPGGLLKKADLPPIRIVKTLAARKISKNVYDFGQNISGWAKIKVRGERGTEVALTYSERLSQDGTIDNAQINMFNHTELKHCDKYILKGGGLEEYEPCFAYHGFRYVEVSNEPEHFEITARVLHTDFEIIGEFQCSDDILNRIHSAARWSTLTNFHSIPTDCPHREQNGWTGDALLSAEQALMNYDMVRAYKKWLNDFKDVQRPSGQLPGIVPTSSWGYNWGSGPAWDSALILIPYYIYEIAGDSSAIEQMWDSMELYMDYMESMSDGYIVDYGLGDWCPPENAKICKSAVTDTAYFYVNAKTMVKCAKILNIQTDRYDKLAENVRNAFRNKFVKDGIVEGDCQTSIACGIYQGLYNEDEIPFAVNRLVQLIEEKDFHIDCGILGTKYIFSALSENGYADVAYRMVVNPTMPSYAYWISQGMTTLCENWDMSASLNHHMFSEVDMWFYKHLAGIQISSRGLVIKPCFVDGIDWVRAKHKDIEVDWDLERIRIKTPQKVVVILGNKKYEVDKGTHILQY